MSEYDYRDDDEYADDLDSFRRPVMGRRIGMPVNVYAGLRL